MWSQGFEDLLQDWNLCRRTAQTLPEPEIWQYINDWWWQAPMVLRGVNWNDPMSWPGPWALLQQDGYTDLERALGIVYTILMIEPLYQDRISIARTRDDNLVLVDHGKYILNWAPGQLLNIRSHPITVIRELTGQQIQQKLIGNI